MLANDNLPVLGLGRVLVTYAKSCDFVMAINWTGACAVNIWVYILSAQLPLEYRLISLRVVFSVHGMLHLVELGD